MGLYKLCPHCGRKVDYYSQCECVDKYKKDKYKAYKNNRKDKKEQSFYSSTAWIRLRDTIRSRQHGMCVVCYLKDNKIINQDVVHHITELKEDYSKRLDEDNLICLCNKHHDHVHNVYDKSDKNKKDMQDILRGMVHKFGNLF